MLSAIGSAATPSLATGAVALGALKLGPFALGLAQHLVARSTGWSDGSRRPVASKGHHGLGEVERSRELGATKGVEEVYRGELCSKLFDLSGSVAFVSGSARGIGAAVAVGLANCGAKVVVSDVAPQEALAPVVDQIKGLGREVLALHCDVRDRKSVEEAVAQAADHFGSVDIMVANAGILGKLAHAGNVSKQSWHDVMAVNLEGAYNCARAAYPHMKKGGRGKVILMSSIAGIRGFGAQVAYCVSKGGMLPLAKSLAVAWGKDNIQVNTLLGGAINTPFLDQVLNTPEKVEYILHRIPAGRLGVPEDMVGPCIFLASQASDYVTGTEIVVDGGGTQVPMLAAQEPEDYKV